MSFNAFGSVLFNAGRLLSSGRKIQHSVKTIQTVVKSQQQVVNLPNRFFTRSLWHLCKQQTEPHHVGQIHRVNGFPKMCGCCGIHTQGDKDMADFLADEIKLEKEGQKAGASGGKLPRVKGFELSQTDGSDVVLKKSSDNEIVSIRFNINHSVDDDPVEFDENQEPEEDMASRPAFTVEINKGGKTTLAIQCQFPQEMAHAQEQEQGEQYDDMIEITEVALLNNNEGNWEDSVYSVSGHIMDGNLYDMLLNLLEERGIDGEFIEQLVDFSTSYEQQQYVKFLENLKNFSEEKDC